MGFEAGGEEVHARGRGVQRIRHQRLVDLPVVLSLAP